MKYTIQGAKRIQGQWRLKWFSGQLAHMVQFASTKREAHKIANRINRVWGNSDQYAYVEATNQGGDK